MESESRDSSAPAPSPESKPNSPPKDSSAPANQPKLPPCDQCRRRKVKCQQSKEGSCDRCIQSALSCTREILRKKRGPKKGSGSVIAKLRGETEQMRNQESGLPPFNLQSLDMQLPGLRQRAYTNDSVESSPLVSPIASHFDYAAPSDPLNVPRSVPLGFGDETSPGFSLGGTQFPSAWQIVDDQPLLQYPSPTSANGYVSVNDLAHQIFQEPMSGLESSLPHQPTYLGTGLGRPNSIDAMLTTGRSTAPASEAVSTASSPRPVHGPKYLYRTNSSPSQIESRILSLASEIGFSGYLMSQCVKQWFRHLYAIQPVIHEPSFNKLLNQSEELSIQDKILIMSMCAVVILHAAPNTDLTPQHKQDLGKELLRQCLHLRHTYEWIENANLTTIISSFFICITYNELNQLRSHHFFLREAIGLAREMQGDQQRATADPIELICRKRMLALLFITERGCAILRNKPISLMRLPIIPRDFFDNHDELVLAGFIQLCNLFSILDEKFVQLWYANGPEDEVEISPFDNIAAVQYELNKLDFSNTQMTEIQKADVLITQHWLRLTFWQAAMRQGLVNSSSTDRIFFYDYPIVIASDLCRTMRGMEVDAIRVHGMGIFHKVFEVTYSLLDALFLANIDRSSSTDLRYLFSCLSASPNSHNTYVRVLENKISTERSAVGSPISQMG